MSTTSPRSPDASKPLPNIVNTLQHPVTFYTPSAPGEGPYRRPKLDIPPAPTGRYLHLRSDAPPDPGAIAPVFGSYKGTWYRPYTTCVAYNKKTDDAIPINSIRDFLEAFLGADNVPDLEGPTILVILSLTTFQWLQEQARLDRNSWVAELLLSTRFRLAGPDTDTYAVRSSTGSILGTTQLVFYN